MTKKESDNDAEFNAAYRASNQYFGDKPEKILLEHASRLDTNRPGLDIGAGQGRNAVFLAQSGIRVDAIDPSAEAVEATARAAASMQLEIRAVRSEAEPMF